MPLPTFYLDFETTGLDPFRDAVVEVGLRGAAHFEALVSDAPPSKAAAQRVHGLSPERLKAQGRPGREVLLGLLLPRAHPRPSGRLRTRLPGGVGAA